MPWAGLGGPSDARPSPGLAAGTHRLFHFPKGPKDGAVSEGILWEVLRLKSQQKGFSGTQAPPGKHRSPGPLVSGGPRKAAPPTAAVGLGVSHHPPAVLGVASR